MLEFLKRAFLRFILAVFIITALLLVAGTCFLRFGKSGAIILVIVNAFELAKPLTLATFASIAGLGVGAVAAWKLLEKDWEETEINDAR